MGKGGDRTKLKRTSVGPRGSGPEIHAPMEGKESPSVVKALIKGMSQNRR